MGRDRHVDFDYPGEARIVHGDDYGCEKSIFLGNYSAIFYTFEARLLGRSVAEHGIKTINRMDERKLRRFLDSYKEWLRRNPAAAREARDEQGEARRMARAFTKERLLSLSEEDLFEYLSPLWAMAMWGNKHYQVDNIVEANGIGLLREQFANLIHGEAGIEKRWDDFRSRVKGVGPAIMSELLCKAYPERYLLWNRKTYAGFRALDISDLPRYEARLDGKMYARLSSIGLDLLAKAKEGGHEEIDDLLALNFFIWNGLQEGAMVDCMIPDEGEELVARSKKDATFIHNDTRDKVAEIGRCLGFRAEVEKKVAAGAVVDAVWEVTIGNMGRVIYVFEVQSSGSVDSLILNLMKAKNNKAVQGIVAVTDQRQIERIRKEIESLPIKNEVKFWDYSEVLKVHEALQFVNESINRLGLVPNGLVD